MFLFYCGALRVFGMYAEGGVVRGLITVGYATDACSSTTTTVL